MQVLILLSYPVFAEDAPVPVAVHVVAEQPVMETFRYPVLVESNESTKLYAEFSGTVLKSDVTLGDTVRPGQVLMTVQRETPGYTPTKFASKIHGEVVLVNVGKGEHVNAGDLLIHIVNPESLQLSIEVPAKERKHIKVGAKGSAVFNDAEVEIAVIVQGISSQVKQDTGTFSVKFSLDGADANISQLYPGMIGFVNMQTHLRDGIVVPAAVIFHEKGRPLVRVIVDGKVAKRPVVLGKSLQNATVEVREGLQVGDQAILEPGKYFKLDEVVSIKE